MRTPTDIDELFERRLTYPDPEARDRLGALIGLDQHQIRLAKILGVLANPQGLKDWARKHHSGARALVSTVLRRPPLIVLAGDVGSGKTELAESIGDLTARREGKIEKSRVQD